MRQTDVAPETTSHGGVWILVFVVAGRQFAVGLPGVQQILGYRPPTKTPRPPPHVQGIIRHQARFVPLVSLRSRLGVQGGGPNHPAILLLRGIGREPILGVIVDEVCRVMSLPYEKVLAPPPRVFGIRAEFLRGVANVGGRPLVWLDEAKLLTSEEPITLLT